MKAGALLVAPWSEGSGVGSDSMSAEAILKCMPDEIQQALLLQNLRPVTLLQNLRQVARRLRWLRSRSDQR